MSDEEWTASKSIPQSKGRQRGIFGIKRSKDRMFFDPKDEAWSSDDSDEDFRPDGGGGGAAAVNLEGEESGSEVEEKKKKNPVKKKKPKKASRIESDDEVDVNGVDEDDDAVADGKDDANSDFEASDYESKKKNGRGVAGRKRKSFVEESDDSDDETGR